jgi:hypothetical protein
MTLFTEVENQLGKVELWPTYILLHLFVDLPDDVTIRKVVAFFYGNGVGKTMAAECYASCNILVKPHKIMETVSDLYR